MNQNEFNDQVKDLFAKHETLITRKNPKVEDGNGIFDRYQYPILTGAHAPVFWRYDLDYNTNPNLLERMGVNCAFNSGAMEFEGKIVLAVRVEGYDRKSFFAVAESRSGVDQFVFRDFPIVIPELDASETNLYDMRVVKHEDGWIYGLFCVESKDPNAPAGDPSSAAAQAGIARTRDLTAWQRLPNLETPSPQQRNVVLHPEFVQGKYGFYTRPQDGFIETGSGGGIGWGLADTIEEARLSAEIIVDEKVYHTIKEVKNGLGPAPLKTQYGWLQLAHGVRNTAAGLRYVLYLFMTDLKQPWKVTHMPGGYFMAPQEEERIGDVSNVLFSNGWVADEDGTVYIYYGSSDTRMHVATSRLEHLVDYVMNTPEDPGRTSLCVQQRTDMIQQNLDWLKNSGPA